MTSFSEQIGHWTTSASWFCSHLKKNEPQIYFL